MRLTLRCLAVLSLLASTAWAGEVFVDGGAKVGGDGTAAAPFRTIDDAVKSAVDGTTITVKGGTYRETVSIRGRGGEEASLTLRAALGERVEVTGFDTITGWRFDGRLAKTTVKEPIHDLCVGGARQTPARFPDKMSPWARVISADGPAMKVDMLPHLPDAELTGLCMGLLVRDGNADWTVPVAKLDVSANTVVHRGAGSWKVQAGDTFVYFNAASFIKYPGDWVSRPVDGGYEITFWPKDATDLDRTQFRRRDGVFRISQSNNVTIQGIEITGAIGTGLAASNCTNLKIERCLIYHNGFADADGHYGMYLDRCQNALVDSCVILANFRGLGICQGSDNTVKGCEIAFNDGDGVNFTGRRSQKDVPALRPKIVQSYIHSQIYLGHADNFQAWGWVNDAEYAGNLCILAGQSMMLENIANWKITNSVFLSAVARHIILGGRYCSVVDVENVDFLWATYGSIGMGESTNGVRVLHNVFYGSALNYAGVSPNSRNNVFWSPNPGVNLITVKDGTGKLQQFKTVDGLADLVLELDSRHLDPQYRNVPQAHTISNAPELNTPDTLHFKKRGSLVGFSQGDTIEINFDRVPRVIEVLTEASLKFKPALAAAPFRDVVVWGWGKRTDIEIDLASPVVGGADQPGGRIDVAAYRRGDLDGSGMRSLPALREEAKAAFPDPSAYLYPYAVPFAYSAETAAGTEVPVAPPLDP